ncbi:MAG: DUF3368 domain-containing protein [Deltaproteobacteria bacterium]|nr:DUF3368 domain-containing protein [Deltaproteobacteria bacterium]MCL5893214.1 DUF3368 domain-containing protein [Deltaproteobacteria bacterium]
MVAVADSSSLIALSICNHLNLLDMFFDKVIVPEAVYDELTSGNKPESGRLKDYLLDKVSKKDINKYLINDTRLGKGELEAIALCKAINADFLIIDDKVARKAAVINNIKITGSLGVLLFAKKKGYIKTLSPCIESLKRSNIRISESLIQKVLQEANEN